MHDFKFLSSETIFSGYVFDVKVDKITYDGTNEARREIIIHHGGAVILPVLPDGKILFVEQYRYPLAKRIWELPAGKLNKGEDPDLCAARELKEETGYSSNNITKLGSIYTSPGFCSEELHLYLAEDLVAGEHAREEGEHDMKMLAVSLEEAKRMITSGEIKDAKSICALMMFISKF